MFLAKKLLEKSVDRALEKGNFSLAQRRQCRGELMGDWQEVCRDAVVAYRERHEDVNVLDDGTPRPFIDWITQLFPDSESLKDFLAFLVNEFLPKLFQAIVTLITMIVAI